jgi:hypothetical protein
MIVPSQLRKFLTMKYRIAVRITPEMTVPHSESSGFFIVVLLCVVPSGACGLETDRDFGAPKLPQSL